MGPIAAHKFVVGFRNPNEEFVYLWLNELMNLLPQANEHVPSHARAGWTPGIFP